jgi:hypothetical protein
MMINKFLVMDAACEKLLGILTVSNIATAMRLVVDGLATDIGRKEDIAFIPIQVNAGREVAIMKTEEQLEWATLSPERLRLIREKYGKKAEPKSEVAPTVAEQLTEVVKRGPGRPPKPKEADVQ